MAPPLAIYYGSQTGCAESIAKRIYDEALEKDLDVTFGALNELQAKLQEPQGATPMHVVVVCSTTGNGDPPDNAAKLWRFIKRRTHPKDFMANIVFTVLGLGDTNYDKFCYMGKSIDKRLHELGAQRFYDMCAADEAMGLEDQVEPWLDGLWGAFLKAGGGGGGGTETASNSEDEAAPSKDGDAASTTVELPRYLQETLLSYEAMFGPLPAPTEQPTDVPRLQSSLYSVRFLDQAEAHTVAPQPKVKPASEEFSETHPFQATIQAAKYLTMSHAERKVLYLELDITGSEIKYTPGDSIGIKCPNRVDDVDALLRQLELDGDALFVLEPPTVAAGSRAKVAKSSNSDRFPTPCTVHDLFLYHVDLLSSPKKAALRALATYCSDEEEKARMLVLSSKSGADKYKTFVMDQQLNFIELLHVFPSCKPPLHHLISALPQLMPRFYSIATSPLTDANKIGIAFTIVDDLVGPESSIRRRGLCTNWLNDICLPLLTAAPATTTPAIAVPIFLRPTRDFLLPASHEWPLILIGPGTGVAPFMGFLQHRHNQVSKRVKVASEVCCGSWRGGVDLDLEEDEEYTKSPSQAVEPKGMYLFFGCRRESEDWIFEHDMKEYVANGTLRQLFTAFSRDQEEKHYVQHQLRAQGKLIAELLLQSGGYVYVCGDGTQMAKDVHEALRQVLEEHGKLSKEDADEQLAALAARQRYVRDIW